MIVPLIAAGQRSPSARFRRETHLRPDRRTELLTWTAPALADNRVALFIGVSKYQNVAQLGNPDAASIAALLKKTGFDSVELRNDLGVTECAAPSASPRDLPGTPTSRGFIAPVTASRSTAITNLFRWTRD